MKLLEIIKYNYRMIFSFILNVFGNILYMYFYYIFYGFIIVVLKNKIIIGFFSNFLFLIKVCRGYYLLKMWNKFFYRSGLLKLFIVNYRYLIVGLFEL